MSIRTEVQKKMEHEPRKTTCAAHGCPMPGSISSSTHPGENSEWVCRFHFNKPVRDWPEITSQVRAMTKEALFPPLPFQPGRVQVKKLSFAKPGKDWASEVLALQDKGLYANEYGVALAKAALRREEKEAA